MNQQRKELINTWKTSHELHNNRDQGGRDGKVLSPGVQVNYTRDIKNSTVTS